MKVRILFIFSLLLLWSGCDERSLSEPISLFKCQARAVNLVCWYPGCFQVSSISDAIEEIKSNGANSVQIVPTWYQNDIFSNDIFEDPDHSPTLDEIRSVIQLAKQKSLRVLLKPHLDSLDGKWRGQINPTNLPAWQSNYQNFILTFADLAQQEDVEILSIGTELKSRSQDRNFWTTVIPKIKAHYDGLLTYSANWDEYTGVPFWNFLDFIGIDFYFPLTENPDASESDMENTLSEIQKSLHSFSVSLQKTLLITEVGYRSVDGAITKPYDFEFHGTVDLQEQADAYQAFLTVFKDSTWVEEIAWWSLDPLLQGGTSDDGYFFYGKPSSDVLQLFWQTSLCPE